MMSGHTIGKNWAGTLKEVGQPFSEWYVADATPDMSATMLNENANKLTQQIAMWEATKAGANKKSVKNINKIIEIQAGKLSYYQQLIQAKGGGGGDDLPPGGGPLPPVPTNKKNILPYAIGAGLVLLMILRKSKS